MQQSGQLIVHSNADLKRVESIQFGLLSPKEIEQMAVCEITNTRSFEDNGNPTEGGINDLRMGTTDKRLRCATCKCNMSDCPGHFGFIHLVKPVFHVGFINQCLKLLKCVCYSCSKILIDDYEKYMEIRKISNPKTRQLKIYNLCKAKKKCNHRRKKKEKKNYDNNENQEELDEKDPFCKIGCGQLQPKYTRENLKIKIEFKNDNDNEENVEMRENDEIEPRKVLEIFSKISDDEIKLLGFNPKYSRPEWMIIQNLAVCPPQVRPSVSVDSSLRSQDDLTHQYNQILKANKELQSEDKLGAGSTTSKNKFDNLQFNVATLMNNDLSSARAHKKSGQPIKAIYARLEGKEGRVRGNLMGKRVDYSARSVISPDPNLQVDELGVPLSIAMNLTFPEVVTDLNMDRLKKLVQNGPTKYPGAKMIKSNDGKTVIDLRYCKNTTDEHLEKGFIVERHMQNGDYVIFNRQPSLHKMSMMGHRVHILPYSTFRLNLSVTTPYNADFDGDEMNMHLPQSLESKSEIMNIMHVPKQIVSPQSNRPVMGIVQDTLIGCKLFTARDNFLTYEQTMNIVMWIDDFNIKNLPMPCIMSPKPLWSGKQIFSLILPEKLNLTRFREDTPKGFKLNLIDNYVEIKKGELIQGIICKKTVGASSGGIVHSIWTEVSPQKTIEFLGNCQKIINNYLLLSGWTVGISDIICDPETSEQVAETLRKMKNNISEILAKAQTGQLESQPGKNMIDSFESNANTELNNAREKAGVLVQNSLLPKNHLKNMVSAGSKGNSTNISQIIAFVGQQNVEGKRIPFNFQNRTLPHFLKDDYKSESKGFVENSFLKGLTPQEFYFHAMGGREGIIDTAVKTSQTGYIQRRLVKALEDIMIKYDGTVRNSVGNLMQFLYGEDGMAGEYIEDQKFETLKLNDEMLERNYKFIERDEDDEFNIFNDLKRFMEDSVIEEMKRAGFSKLRLDLDSEFEQIKKDRDDMRKNLLVSGDNAINIPVNIKTIITYAENDNHINMFSKSDLNPMIVLQKVKELKEDLEIVKGSDKISKEGQECALTLFNKVLNYSLSTKNIIINHRLNKKAFDFVCGEIKSKFEQAIVRPGEMVGSIAAQSIGEPATQMTLNTFHLAGVSSANVTLGVPRLKEVINIAKKLNTPSMNIYLKEKEGGYNNDEILELRGKVEHTSLLNIVTLSEIYYDPDIKNTIIKEDKNMIDEYIEICEDEIDRLIQEDSLSPWLLRLVLNKDYINIKMETIEEIIKKKVQNANAVVIHTRETADEKKFHIRLCCKNEEKEEEKKEKYKSLNYLKLFENGLLTEVSLCGIDSIKKVYVRNVKQVKYDNKGALIPNKEAPEESILETDGTNLAKIFEVEEVDFRRTISNDINEIYNVLGIEAVRKSLVQELRNVLRPYGIYVNYRHISILCDLMTQKGYLTSITRHGLNRNEYGPIRKASFEETVEILLDAGIFSEKDELKGISENILLGKLTHVGTGYFDLLIDFKAFENENRRNEEDYAIEEEEVVINSNYDQGDNMHTPIMQGTPLYAYPHNNVSASIYDNSGNFTPAPDYNGSSLQSPFHNPSSLYKGESSFISTPNNSQKLVSPASSDYNPQSDYNNIRTPAPYSPLANEDGYRVQSEYVGSAYSPRSPNMNSGGPGFYSRRITQGTGTRGPNSSYSPTTPAIIRPSSGNSPPYIPGSGMYNSSPKVQDSVNTSQYVPASPNYYPTSPNYGNVINNASPFYNQEKNDENDDDEEEEDEDGDKKNDNNDD